MDKRLNFRKKEISELPTPKPGSRDTYFDTQVRGLLVRVTDNGVKRFYVRRKLNGVSHRVLIGTFPELSVEHARTRALEICSSFAQGLTPANRKLSQPESPTFGDLLNTYFEQYANDRCIAAREMAAVLRRYLADWYSRTLDSISKTDVVARVNHIGKVNGIVAANHCITYARAAINWCIKNGFASGDNPWANVPKFKTKSRDRFLKPDEIGRFFAALANLRNDSGFRDYIYISLFTGARRSNVLAMRWRDIDFALGTWTIPRTKNGDCQIIPLTSSALEILLQRSHNPGSSEWVFPSLRNDRHAVEPRKAWKALLQSANIQDLRMHDLRRTLASYMAMGNQSLHMIGKVLGHKSPTATQIYSRFAHDPVRQAMEKAHADMLALSTTSDGPKASDSGRAS